MKTAQNDSPVSRVEGIGPATAAHLAQHGIVTVFDLLRASIDGLATMLEGVASRDQARGWRTAAALLQVEGMTQQWAEALARGGFDAVEELALADADRVRAALEDAVESGITPDAPDADTLAELRIDAVRLHLTRALQVTVTDLDGAPLPGAVLQVGDVRETTDARGRARLMRIPAGQTARLVVQADGYETEVVDAAGLLVDEFALGVEAVALVPLEDGADPEAPALSLSEFEGDLLPPLSVHSMTTEAREADRLREGDLLLVRRAYADGVTVQLTSKYLEYRDGTFVAVSYRVPQADLSDDVELRDHVVRTADGYRPIVLTPERLELMKARRRARRATESGPPPQTIAERDVRMLAYEEALRLERARGSMTRGR